MDKTITVFSSFDEMKAAALREWQSLPAHQLLGAVSELTRALWELQNPGRDFSHFERTLVCLSREKQ